jgi:hypothetical protein
MDTSAAELVFIPVIVVGTAGRQGFESGQGQEILASLKPPGPGTLSNRLALVPSQTAWLWYPSSFIFKGRRGSFPGLKRPDREVEHSHPSRGEFMNKWRCSTSLPICF